MHDLINVTDPIAAGPTSSCVVPIGEKSRSSLNFQLGFRKRGFILGPIGLPISPRNFIFNWGLVKVGLGPA